MSTAPRPSRSTAELYPSVDASPSAPPEPNPTSSLYPIVDTSDLATDLFPDSADAATKVSSAEDSILAVPHAILHLIDRSHSVELGSGKLTLFRLTQGDHTVAVLAQLSDDIQWPIIPDIAAVKLDPSHYFFSLPDPASPDQPLNYGLTIISPTKEQEAEFDHILSTYCNFSVQKVASKEPSEVIDQAVEVDEAELEETKKRSAAYWTTLAPNVEDYSGSVAKAIATGSGHLVRGILWCGDVTVDRLKWGNEFLKNKMTKGDKDAEISPEMMRRIKRVKSVTKMSEKVAGGILSGVIKVSGFFTSSVVNSKLGKKFFNLLPGEVVLASLDGFGRICDAVEMAGKNVLSESSTVTTGLVSHKYGDKAAAATSEGLDAAGHAIGTAWSVFKIRKALDPKSAIKPTTLAKSAIKASVADLKSKNSK